MHTFYRDRIPGTAAVPQITYPHWVKGTDIAPHNMTSDVLPVPYVAIKSTEFATLQAYKAFDNLLTNPNYWVTASGGAAPCYIGIDLGATNLRRLYSYKLWMNVVPEPNRAPKAWTFETSNTGAWAGEQIILDTRTNQTSWGSGEGREFTCAVIPSYYTRYFRVNISANNGDANFTQMGEIYLFEAVGSF